MKKNAIVIVFFLCCTAITTVTGQQLTDYVNPNIGTTNCLCFFYTPASMPFGMA